MPIRPLPRFRPRRRATSITIVMAEHRNQVKRDELEVFRSENTQNGHHHLSFISSNQSLCTESRARLFAFDIFRVRKRTECSKYLWPTQIRRETGGNGCIPF